MSTIRLQASHIIARRELVYQPGQVVISNGKIVEVTSSCDQRPDFDLGQKTLLPGLVNPHTHLEFSHLEHPFAPGENFPEWIAKVVNYRRVRNQGLSLAQVQSQVQQAVHSGLSESYQNGIVALCDIVTAPWTIASLSNWSVPSPTSSNPNATETNPWDVFARPQLAVIAALEQIGMDENRIAESRDWRIAVESEYRCKGTAAGTSGLIGLGLSPHAPYSTRWQLMVETVRHAMANDRLVVVHLAESEDERQWINSGAGAFQEVFERLQIPTKNVARPAVHQIIRELGTASRALLVHGNYLTDEEIQLAAEYREKLAIVYCPRTHSHFGHAEYPLEKLLRAGLNVVLATDSRASNPDLNLWQDARHALAKHHSLAPSQAFHAITRGAADALAIGHQYGSIVPGYKAALCVATAPQRTLKPKQLFEFLLEEIEHVTPLSAVMRS